MKQNRTKKILVIIAAVLLLHIMALLFLLVFYHTPSHFYPQPIAESSIDAAETIFYNDPETRQLETPTTSEQRPDDETCAELKPGASTLGASMEMPEEEIGLEMSSQNETAQKGETTSEIHITPENLSLESSPTQMPSLINEELIPEYVSNPDTIITSSNLLQESKKSSAQEKKIQAQKAMAQITKGYLEQLHNEGENLIKTIGGDPTKKPTATQLKYERYLAKIQWCIQNAHYINIEKCKTSQPVESTMKIYFTIDRKGAMDGLRITQSSGNAFVDNYIKSLFEFASTSFPPLPAYIQEDPYPLLYTVLINWNTNTSSRMGFARN